MVREGMEHRDPAEAEILIIEDDLETAHLLARRAGEHFGRPAVIAASLYEAEAYLDGNTPLLVLLDMLLPDGDGSELLCRLEGMGVAAVGVITAAPSLYRATAALRGRAADFLVKPFTDEQLVAMFERLACRLGEREELLRLREQLERADAVQQHLRLKIDVLCKDLVGGYQQLLAKLHDPADH